MAGSAEAALLTPLPDLGLVVRLTPLPDMVSLAEALGTVTTLPASAFRSVLAWDSALTAIIATRATRGRRTATDGFAVTTTTNVATRFGRADVSREDVGRSGGLP